jgi:hypothetical protein|tara:strand:+ start:709 stop:918 length:210 start_codon:yes stop_codon:yes gene_type:complete
MSRIAEDKVQLLKANLSDSARQVIGKFAREAGINQQDLIGEILVDFIDRTARGEIRLEPVKLVRSNVDS